MLTAYVIIAQTFVRVTAAYADEDDFLRWDLAAEHCKTLVKHLTAIKDLTRYHRSRSLLDKY